MRFISKSKFFNRYLPFALAILLIMVGALTYVVINSPRVAEAALSHIETICTGGANPAQITFSTATTQGELIVVITGVGFTTGTDGGVTDNASGGSSVYTSITSVGESAGYANFYYAYNVVAGITQVTLAVGAGNTIAASGLCAAHYTGVATVSPLDINQVYTGVQGTPWASTATGVLSQANELIIGAVVNTTNDCGDTFTATGSMTQRGNWATCSGTAGAFADQIVSATDSVTYNGTQVGGTAHAHVAIATFRSAASGPLDTITIRGSGAATNPPVKIRGGPPTPISRVETVCSNSTNAVTFSTATTQGELIVVSVGVAQGSSAPDGGVTDNKSGGSSTYTSIQSISGFGAAGKSAANLYYTANAASGITQITLSPGAGNEATYSGLCASHYTGIATSNPLDVSQDFTAAQDTPWSSTATGVLSQANELVVGAVINFPNGAGDVDFTATGALTERGEYNSNGGVYGAYADAVVSSTASVTYSGTSSLAGANNTVAIATFKGLSAPTNPGVKFR